MTERKTLVDAFEWDAVRRIATADLTADGGPGAINAAFAELCAKHTQAVALQIICQVVYRESRLSLVTDAITAFLTPDDGAEDAQEPSPLH